VLSVRHTAVGTGYAPNDCQVSQTGKIIALQFYIA
jgi:electron transfer flavoprotein alpha subunit